LHLWRIPASSSPGTLGVQANDLEHGEEAATVRMRREGIAVLSASFDPGWTAEVDGHPASVFPVAPALPATRVPAGIHSVAFRYVGFSYYAGLFLLCAISLTSLALIDRKRSTNRRDRRRHLPRLIPEDDRTSAGSERPAPQV
jgi:hypothetical protein